MQIESIEEYETFLTLISIKIDPSLLDILCEFNEFIAKKIADYEYKKIKYFTIKEKCNINEILV